jgi:transcriptional regulator with XRE-family HTH domain
MAYRKGKPKTQLAEGSPELSHAMSLVRRLKNSGMTQKEMAAKIKVPDSTISGWFHGVSKPGVSTYEKLKTYFGESL